MDTTFIKELTARANELGVRFEDPNTLLHLQNGDQPTTVLLRGDSRGEFQMVYSPTLTLSTIGAHKTTPARQRLFLVGPRVTERSAEQFRRMSINYLDQAGNAHIDFPGVYIDVRGRKPTHQPVPTHTHRGGANLFSEKRAQVIFAILEWPELLHDRVRALATAAGVSIGQAQSTLGLLEELGFLTNSRKILPTRREDLIDQWVSAYRTGLSAKWDVGAFTGTTLELSNCNHPLFISGEAAVPELLRPESITLYTAELPLDLIRTYRWRKTQENPNIYVRRKFWDTPWEQEVPGPHKAPKLLVYADLMASGEGRQHEAAAHVRSQLQ